MRLLSIIFAICIVSHLKAQTLFKPLPEFPKEGQNSRGIAWGDLNGDGWPDAVVGNTAPDGLKSFNLIYWNEAGEGFRLATLDDNHLWTEGIYLIDVDNDYDLDIFCSTDRNNKNQLYLNDGQGKFKLTEAGDLTAEPMNSPGSCWCDYDLDGDLDAFVLGKDLEDDRLYRNNGNLKFEEVKNGPWVGKGNEARACVWGDLNGDNKPDLYINNYIIRRDGQLISKHRNYLFFGSESGFIEKTEGDMVTIEHAGYGTSVIDLDSDGDLDIYVSNISMSDNNDLYRNDGLGNFETVNDLEVTTYLRRPSKGHFWADLNLDGLVDLYLANGTVGTPVRYPEIQNYLFLQNADSSFQRIYNDPSVVIDDVSAGTAAGDYDLDGDMDIIVANWENRNNNNHAYTNQTEQKNWIKLKLRGTKSNSYGICSLVTIITSDNGIKKTQKRYHYPFTGFGSMSEPIVHFGIGDSDLVSSIEVIWPNGQTSSFSGVAVNKFYELNEDGKLSTLIIK